LAATKIVSSGRSVLIGGCDSFWFCGICCVFSGPTPIRTGSTMTALGVMVTLTRLATCGRGLLVWLSVPQPAATSASAPTAPATANLALPRPIARNLAEGQVDDARRNAIFTYGELGPGLGLAPQDRQADRPEGGGDDGAAELADLLLTQGQGRARRRRSTQPQSP
jgi:hypothetical protein